MKIYHVSETLDDMKVKVFKPRIPELPNGFHENRDIKRVCFSEKIELALGAIGKYSPDEFPDVITVYELDLNEFSGKTLSPKEISQNKYVYDAELTKEWWVLDEIKLTPRHYLLDVIEYDTPILVHESDKNRILNLAKELFKNNTSYKEILNKMNNMTLFEIMNDFIWKKENSDWCDEFYDKTGYSCSYFPSVIKLTEININDIKKNKAIP